MFKNELKYGIRVFWIKEKKRVGTFYDINGIEWVAGWGINSGECIWMKCMDNSEYLHVSAVKISKEYDLAQMDIADQMENWMANIMTELGKDENNAWASYVKEGQRILERYSDNKNEENQN